MWPQEGVLSEPVSFSIKQGKTLFTEIFWILNEKTLLVLSTGLLFSHYVVSNSFVNPWTVASPDFSVHGISQAIILEWVIIFSSMGSS